MFKYYVIIPTDNQRDNRYSIDLHFFVLLYLFYQF